MRVAPNDFPPQTAENPKMGSFRTKNYRYDTFREVLIELSAGLLPLPQHVPTKVRNYGLGVG